MQDKDVNKFLLKTERILRNIGKQKKTKNNGIPASHKDISNKEMIKLKQFNKKRKHNKSERYR